MPPPVTLAPHVGQMDKPASSKVPLGRGRSLMDWVKVMKNTPDMSGTGGAILDVSPQQLAEHNTEQDCWLAIRGRVYNVTRYLDYHPGGREELMRGAGADATSLFIQYHPWVNFDTMLKDCLVGRLSLSSRGPSLFTTKKSTKLTKPVSAEEKVASETPRYDWFQTDTHVNLVIFSKSKNLKSNQLVILKTGEKDFHLLLFLRNQWVYQIHLDLHEKVLSSEATVNPRLKSNVDVKFTKTVPNQKWPCLGRNLAHHATYQMLSNLDRPTFQAHLIRKLPVTHNTYLLTFALPDGITMQPPIGYHVYLSSIIDGVDVSRPYTVFPPKLFSQTVEHSQENDLCDDRTITLLIKMYPTGTLTSHIKDLSVGDSMRMSIMDGSFDLGRARTASHIIMFAAGTGFTPMAGLLNFLLFDDYLDSRNIKLIFFNRKKEDIIFYEKLDSLQTKFSSTFSVNHVLSEESAENWSGSMGFVTFELVESCLPTISCSSSSEEDSTGSCDLLICVCGPTRFTLRTVEFIEECAYPPSCLHIFTG